MTALPDPATLPFPKSGLPLHRSQPHSLCLAERIAETSDTVTYVFDTLDGPLQHHPGQAVAIDLPMDTGTATRTFTIASGGLDPHRLSITVKAGPSGHATRWMHEHLAPGDRLSARGPFGRFTLLPYPGQPLLLIGGGSGFTPMMSMLRWLHGRGETTDVAVIQVARQVGDLLYTEELTRIAAEMPNLRLFEVVTAPKAGEVWRGYRGRPDRAMLRSMLPDAARRVVFCCGPDPFMTSMGQVLRAEGLDPARFLTETFGAAPVKAKVVAPTDDSAQTGLTVSYRGRDFDVSPDDTLVSALAAQGVRVPTGCGEGQCGTCRLKLVSGEVDMAQQGGLSESEVADGYILACCSRPKGPVTLADPA
ncbi:flavin reductase family protein [Thalassovita mangrovi]|uniref:2Fe-2S iron-sulfur cluster binding domain-containing protein n=1 Tax=Thalassovita mangrovi TaxID=2692236 RepID=A0A6L8LJP5_9RHOB|nr:iron-sulfur cluster-binding domain-containing protein [Thalassovita mangrovi]MYM56271.1 2Fe-2S iron-sulfur cluster binding domain-containing protein [Thalassovita mangrovi]